MTCSACGGENEAGRRFCGECGSPLAISCSACGSANSARAKYCGECGIALAGGSAADPASTSVPATADQPTGGGPAARAAGTVTEHRLVSVLFADLVGFTSLSEARDSEEVRDLLSAYFERCQMVVERYGGAVEKFIGDAVMAVWGAPVANDDDAERAVRAALELVDAIAEMGREVGTPELRVRAGVLTGEATVNLGASSQGMVAGSLVNTAARIQSVADAGTVMVGDATKRATAAAVVYSDAGHHTLKGIAEPVRLWQAHRVVAGVGGAMKSEGLEPPFVGRDRDLKLVKELFHACVDDRRAHLVQVTGIPGIGKSRLGWEFFKYMDGLQQVYRWHRGRCLSYGEGVTYWALSEMVRGRAGILEGEDRQSALAKLRETLDQYVPAPADRSFVEPRLAHLLGLEDRTASDKSDLFAGWRLFFERLAAVDPVVMVFEDLQWADPSLREFIDYLLEWSRAFPIFVMTLARSGVGSGLGGPKRNATSISLEPLSERAMESLLTGLVPGLSAELTAKILDRAQGVPLYAVETVRMLLDRHLLVQEGSVYRPSGPVEDLEVPETLHAVIAARLDGLNHAERRLVQDASVLGKTFTRAALAALSGLPERELDPLLAALLAKEVLSVQADPRSPERGQYGFLQDLVRTVAYEMLSRKDRKAKHLAVAAYLEATRGSEEEIVEVVASHFLEAYRIDTHAEDAPPIRDRAREMLARAGERAASLAAGEEAEAYFERAAELTDSADQRASLIERGGDMALLQGHTEQAAARFADAKRLFEESGQPHPAARSEARLAETALLQNHLEQAIESTRRAYGILAGDEPDRDLAMVAAQFGRLLALADRDPEATPVLEEALRLAEQLELPEIYSQALSSRAIGLMRQSRFDEGEILLRRALQVALDNDLTGAAFRAWNNLGVLLESQDRCTEELEMLEPSLALARLKGDRGNELQILTGFGVPLLAVGRWDQALSFAAEALASKELASIPFAGMGLLDVSCVHVRRGDVAAARELVDAIGIGAASLNAEGRTNAGAALSELLRAEGRPAEALALAQEIVELAAVLGLAARGVKGCLVQATEAALDLGDVQTAEELLGVVRRARPGLVTPSLRGHAARLEARVLVRRDGHEDPQPRLLSALQTFRELQWPFEVGVTLLEMGEWLAHAGRGEEAAPAIADAREIFQQLGARPWLARAQLAWHATAPTSRVWSQEGIG